MMIKIIFDDGSFRDPLARVFYSETSLSSSKPNGFKQFKFIEKIINNETLSQYLINTEVVDIEKFESIGLKR